jgi:hypothetical protein
MCEIEWIFSTSLVNKCKQKVRNIATFKAATFLTYMSIMFNIRLCGVYGLACVKSQSADCLSVHVLCCSWGGWVWGLQTCTTPKALVIVYHHYLLLPTALQDAALSPVWRNCHSWYCSLRASSRQQHLRPAHTLQQVPGKFQLLCECNLFYSNII